MQRHTQRKKKKTHHPPYAARLQYPPMTHFGEEGPWEHSSLVQTFLVACNCFSTPFSATFGAGHHAQCPPCHPTQQTVALHHPRAAPFPGSPQGRALCRRDIAAASPGTAWQQPWQAAPTSALHTCRPCAEAERLQRAGAAAEEHVLAFKK